MAEIHGEKPDGRGHHSVPVSHASKQRFLHWLLTPAKERDPRTMNGLADEIGVTSRTLRNWQKEKEFLEEWNRLYLATIGSPARKSQIMDTLFGTATDSDDPKHVQAAREYFAIEGSLKPQQMEVKVSRPASELTDLELQEMLQEAAAAEAARRSLEAKNPPSSSEFVFPEPEQRN